MVWKGFYFCFIYMQYAYFKSKHFPFLLWFTIVLLSACSEDKEDRLFHSVSAAHSNIHFSNDISETAELNILNFHYIYNGGGIGIGDFDKNGLADLVFSGNQVDSKIYLNQGNLKFKNITETTNFAPKGWATGVSIVDLNADSWPDIYMSIGGYQCNGNCKNYLYIHQGLDANGIPTFQEMAAEYGLDDGLYTQQAAFFDYDLDGDLDVYLLHNVIDKRDKNVPSEKRFINKKSKDQLLENNGEGKFIDVSEKNGIVNRGYGLGITINDFNKDNLPDIYVANDFLSDDLLYLNKGNNDGFKEVSHQKLKHTSYNAMGVDVADVNNDALPDIFVLDMLPEYNEREKSMQGFMNYNKYLLTLRQGYHPQFVRNTLQMHNGFLNGELLPFSEAGYVAGIHNTDWSWTPLLADFDNDGDRDLFVTNGYGKDITDLDFINYTQNLSPFGTKENREKELFKVVQKMESIKMPNYIFENEGNLNFKNRKGEWLKEENSISNGAAYADLDNDGDLDLVVNNLNEKAFVLENKAEEREGNNWLKVKFEGKKENPSEIGAKISIWTEGKIQTHYHSPIRGYLSSVEDIIHFGIGKNKTIDSLIIEYATPSDHYPIQKKFYNLKSNQVFNGNAEETEIKITIFDDLPIFKTNLEIPKTAPFNFTHQENQHQDFDAQPLLLHQLSKQGPCLATANIDGNLGDELFIGGAKGYSAQIFTQQKDGTWRSQELPDAECEDTDATFFDYDLDGDLDLYVVSGGTEYLKQTEEYADRLYLNDGKGNFSKTKMALPKNSGSCVIANNIDKNDEIELFVGGRIIPREYPNSPNSSLLVHFPHQGKRLIDYANKLVHPLDNIGMVSDAIWSDIDDNGWKDLILVGEYMPITIFKNNQGHFNQKDTIQIPNSNGFWNCIAKGDFDKDGDDDFIIGNLGENSKLKATPSKPIALFKGDLDKNGSPDPFIGQYSINQNGTKNAYPVHARDDVMKQVPSIKNRFVKYAEFGKATFSEILQKDMKSDQFLIANNLSTSYLENKGDGIFTLKALPKMAQLAPIQDILVDDVDGDGNLDALLTGNDFSAEKNGGRYDAFNGLLLKGDGKGNFEAVPTAKSGFYVPGDGRDIVKMTDKDGNQFYVVGQNAGGLLFFQR